MSASAFYVPRALLLLLNVFGKSREAPNPQDALINYIAIILRKWFAMTALFRPLTCNLASSEL
jgi:hypothetical protein